VDGIQSLIVTMLPSYQEQPVPSQQQVLILFAQDDEGFIDFGTYL
jgi:hypothetical protein